MARFFVGQRVKLARNVPGVSASKVAKVKEGVILSIGFYAKGTLTLEGGRLSCDIDCHCQFGDQKGSCQFSQLEPITDSNQLVSWQSMLELGLPVPDAIRARETTT